MSPSKLDPDLIDFATGKPLAAIPEQDRALRILKELSALIEAGEIKLNWLYILAQTDDQTSRGSVIRKSWDIGITVANAVYHLEMEKRLLLKMMEGDPR